MSLEKKIAMPQPQVLRGLIRDFTAGLTQQMFFWGRDVEHRDGNLLSIYGCERNPSEELDGTSCYRLPVDSGVIELHGACVSHCNNTGSPGLLFVRNRRRCYLYSGAEPPVPGCYVEDFLDSGPVEDLYFATCRFLDWWLEYEEWIAATAGPDHRESCYQLFRKLPRSKPWLTPGEAQRWLRKYRRNPASLKRARFWKQQPTHSIS